jgi:hypothetical protein
MAPAPLKTPRGAGTLENILNAKWGGPPGPRPTPTSAPESGSGGTRADGGVRPTSRCSLLLLCGTQWEHSCRCPAQRPDESSSPLVGRQAHGNSGGWVHGDGNTRANGRYCSVKSGRIRGGTVRGFHACGGAGNTRALETVSSKPDRARIRPRLLYWVVNPRSSI